RKDLDDDDDVDVLDISSLDSRALRRLRLVYPNETPQVKLPSNVI
ncbi:hypothetical protein Tco_0915351, partial [Tanacetum coccineum]